MNDSTTWYVRVDWTANKAIDDDEADQFLEQLGRFRPSIDFTDQADHVAIACILHIEGGTLRQAMATGLQQVEAAAGIKAVGVEVITRTELEHRMACPVIPNLVGYTEIAALIGVSRQRVTELAARPDFPPAVVTTTTGPLRVRQQVEAWIPTWKAKRKVGRPKKAEEVAE